MRITSQSAGGLERGAAYMKAISRGMKVDHPCPPDPGRRANFQIKVCSLNPFCNAGKEKARIVGFGKALSILSVFAQRRDIHGVTRTVVLNLGTVSQS